MSVHVGSTCSSLQELRILLDHAGHHTLAAFTQQTTSSKRRSPATRHHISRRTTHHTWLLPTTAQRPHDDCHSTDLSILASLKSTIFLQII